MDLAVCISTEEAQLYILLHWSQFSSDIRHDTIVLFALLHQQMFIYIRVIG